MISYTKRYVNIVSLLITMLIYIFLNESNFFFNKIDFNIHLISNIFKRNLVLVELNSNNVNQNTKEDTEKNSEIQNNYSVIQTEENSKK